MTCLNCCALPPESINKLRYVSSPATHFHLQMPHYSVAMTINTTPNTRPRALYRCTVCDDRISRWMGPNVRPVEKQSAPVHIKICWRPTWDLHYVHLAALGFHNTTTVVLSSAGPYTVLTEAQMGADIGNRERHISLHILTQRNVLRSWKCFYQAIRCIFCWSSNEKWKKKGSPLKCVTRSDLLFQLELLCIMMKDTSLSNVHRVDYHWIFTDEKKKLSPVSFLQMFCLFFFSTVYTTRTSRKLPISCIFVTQTTRFLHYGWSWHLSTPRCRGWISS